MLLANNNMISFRLLFLLTLLLFQTENILAGISDEKCNEYMQLSRQRRDLGKDTVAPYEFPHMAALVYENNEVHCGGSLISDQYILTSGSCVKWALQGPIQKVRLGDLNIKSDQDDVDVQEYTVVERIVHPEYKPPKVYNDIGLLKLNRRVNFTKSVRPACLQVDEQLNGNKLIATGWGTTEYGGQKSERLMKVTLDLFTNVECAKYYNINKSTKKLTDGIVSSMLCAGGKTEPRSTCAGDGGGPVQILRSGKTDVYNIVGIVSFGKACGVVNVPEVETRVSSYVPWIESIVWP